MAVAVGRTNGAGYTLAVNPSTITVVAGQSANTTFTFTPYGGYVGTVLRPARRRYMRLYSVTVKRERVEYGTNLFPGALGFGERFPYIIDRSGCALAGVTTGLHECNKK